MEHVQLSVMTESLVEVGEAVLLYTDTYPYIGHVIRITSSYVELTDASKVFNEGRLSELGKKFPPEHWESEPYWLPIRIAHSRIGVTTTWPWRLPTEAL
jgi:hypothetical protein